MYDPLTLLAAALVLLGVGYGLKCIFDRNALDSAESLKKNAEREAETIVKEAKIAAKEEQIRAREEFEDSTRKRRDELQKLDERLTTREDNLERKATSLEKRLEELEQREERVRQRDEENRKQRERLDELVSREVSELERIASLSQDAARQQLLDRLSDQLEGERNALVRRFQDEAQQRCEREALDIMINAMERYANDCAYERTTSTIPLPNDEMKGRIIGREGRNIRAIEAASGVSVLIDDTPEAVVISCFDPVRREIARIALERLIADGRIHPTRIEEMLGKVKEEIDAEIAKVGQQTVEELGLTSVKPNLVKLLGRLKYRYSYSQNVLAHSVECAYLMGSIASQLHLDEQQARRAGLLHDIGKAVDHEVEGTHALIGADILKRAGENEEIILAVGAHHEEMDRTSPLAILTGVCDAISASRPGARRETLEKYGLKPEEYVLYVTRGHWAAV